MSWQYFAPDDGSLSEVAVHPTGTVFVSTEGYYYPDVTYLVALDGETGASKRWRLANGSAPTGPVVRDDGSVVALFNPADDSGHRHLQLVTVKDPTGPASFTDLYLAAPQYPFYPDRYRLIPHDDALLLAQTRNGTDLMRIAANGTVSPVTTLLPPVSGRTVAQVDYAVAGSTGMAIIRRDSGQYQTPYNVYTATFDPVALSGGATWAGTDPYATYRFMTADEGVLVSGEATSNDTQVAAGLWAALGGKASMSVGTELVRHSSSSFLTGSSESSNAPNNRFTGRQQAAVAALQYFFPFSQLTNREYGGSVCKTSASTGTPYSYSEPNKGTPERVPPSGCGAGLTIESWYHTHPRAEADPEPSFRDQGLTVQGRTDYLGNWCGYMYQFGRHVDGSVWLDYVWVNPDDHSKGVVPLPLALARPAGNRCFAQ